MIIQEYDRFVDHGLGKASFLRQYYTLVMRDMTVALRDPALYYLQFILVLFFGFLVGAVFTNTKFVIDNNLSNESGGILWVVYMMVYTQIFKVMMYSSLLLAMTHMSIISSSHHHPSFTLGLPSLSKQRTIHA